MMLYMDDDHAQPVLVQMLRHARHDVRLPLDLGFQGREDPVHLRQAIREDRVLVTGNHKDFEQLHQLILEAQGHHPGVLIVRRDNDPKRDLNHRGIVRAIGNLLSANVSIANECLILNHWR